MVDANLPVDSLERIARSVRHWVQQGWLFVPLPWVAPARYTDATKPDFVTTPDLATPHGNLLASGEQAFLMLLEQAQLPAGERYIGWTPCFRDEAVFDARHHFYFMKSELFQRSEPSFAFRQLEVMIERARQWFQQELLDAGVEAVVTRETVSADQIDLVVGDLELGSYGIRQFMGHTYVYGTACAEPRLSEAIQRSAPGL
jgi:hypothetical protein